MPVWTNTEISSSDLAASHYPDLLCEFGERFRLVLLMSKLKVTKSVSTFSGTELMLSKDVLPLAPVSSALKGDARAGVQCLTSLLLSLPGPFGIIFSAFDLLGKFP